MLTRSMNDWITKNISGDRTSELPNSTTHYDFVVIFVIDSDSTRKAISVMIIMTSNALHIHFLIAMLSRQQIHKRRHSTFMFYFPDA